jgi:pimeloyl-ACP methyl ester carboxylesterase
MREPLVLLPGLSCDAAVWQPVIDRLPGIACMVPVLPARDDLGAMAADILPSLPPAFALAGHSMGGRVALEIVRRAPGRVTRLALLDTGFQPLEPGQAGEAERARRQSWLAIAREQGMRAMALRWAEPMVHAPRLADAALMDAIHDMIARSSPERFAREIAALLARPGASELLASIRCPTLVACGRYDGWADVAQHRELASRIPGSRLSIVEGCGHMAPMERPPEVAQLLAAWIGEPVPAPAAVRA